MTIKRHIFDVEVAPPNADGKPDWDAEPLEFPGLRVIQADMLRGELEGSKHGISAADKAPMAGQALWIWAALQRTGGVVCKFSEFRARVITIQARKGEDEDVDPTPPGPSEPPSD